MGRRPTGDVEATIRTTPKPDSLLLQGQTVARADYPGLWAWIVEQGLSPSVFGAGDGSTTFVLPDYRDRVMAGASATRPVGTLFGAQTKAITTANLPAHDHDIEVGSETRVHGHPSTGDHVGHAWEACAVGGPVSGNTVVLFSSFSSPAALGGHHYHGNNGNGHEHYATVFPSTGGGTAFNVEQATFSGNWLIWC